MPPAEADLQAPSITWARQFWRVAVGMGIPFGLILMVIDLLLGPTHGAASPLWRFASRSAFFGLGMAGLIVGISRLTLKTATPPPLHPRRVLSLPCGSETGVQRVRAALLRVPDSSIGKFDPTVGTVVAMTGPSWKSWGEVITAHVQPSGAEECIVHLESRPRMRFTVADYGANARNVDLVEAELKA